MVIVPISKSHSRYRHTLWTFTAYIMFASPRRQAISAEEESTSVLLQGLGDLSIDVAILALPLRLAHLFIKRVEMATRRGTVVLPCFSRSRRG
jgi:hypothetical protein